MLGDIHPRLELGPLARKKKLAYIAKTVKHKYVDEFLHDGWRIQKQYKTSSRLILDKQYSTLLEDRVWTLLYQMGFDYLSGERGAKLRIKSDDPDSPTNQVDVVAIDHDVALAVECKSAEIPKKNPRFQEQLAKHGEIRKRFSAAVRNKFSGDIKRQIALVMSISNIVLTDNDKKRAADQNIVIFDGSDLAYYETLVMHLGPAARYQFLSDILPGKHIQGLDLTVPAVRSRMGGFYCYTFSISPEFLLKIAYVSHRSKGKASDVDAYQRMIKKQRLKKIKEYISEEGMFPTNIVVNLEKGSFRFDRGKQESETSEEATFGWLKLRPTYKSAWLIDGQHRLYAYSGHERATTSSLSVLAFEGLPPSKQAELFIDINAAQKSVKSSLLQELYAELHWNADDIATRVKAVISKAVQSMNQDPQSPFFNRILLTDQRRSPTRCISMASIFGELARSGFYYSKKRIVEYGPLWAEDNQSMLTRTSSVTNAWFELIQDRAKDWWDLGSDDNGGLAMNGGVAICLGVLKSIFDHMELQGLGLGQLSDVDLIQKIAPYGKVLGHYFGTMTPDERKLFRALRGVQGKTTGMRHCQQALREKFPHFNPVGLEKFIQQELAQTNKKAFEIISRIESSVKKDVIEQLKEEFGEEDSLWWFEGVPGGIRKRIDDKINEDKGRAGGREENFNLIHFREIVISNWKLFDRALAYGKSGDKKARTAWLNDVNQIRKISHHEKGISVTLEELEHLQTIDDWLQNQLRAASLPGSSMA